MPGYDSDTDDEEENRDGADADQTHGYADHAAGGGGISSFPDYGYPGRAPAPAPVVTPLQQAARARHVMFGISGHNTPNARSTGTHDMSKTAKASTLLAPPVESAICHPCRPHKESPGFPGCCPGPGPSGQPCNVCTVLGKRVTDCIGGTLVITGGY